MRHAPRLLAIIAAVCAGCDVSTDPLGASNDVAQLEARVATLESQNAQQMMEMARLRRAAGSAAALAMCRATDPAPNSTTVPLLIEPGATGDAVCAAFRPSSRRLDTHLVYLYEGGSAEGASGGASGCSLVADYSSPALAGWWACCER